LGHPDVDDYLEFVAARARPNTTWAPAYDLKVFFTVVPKAPLDVPTRDVLAFLKVQGAPRRGVGVVRLEDGETGLSARTIKRRLTSVSGLFEYLRMRGNVDIVANPVPGGIAARSAAGRHRSPHDYRVDLCYVHWDRAHRASPFATRTGARKAKQSARPNSDRYHHRQRLARRVELHPQPNLTVQTLPCGALRVAAACSTARCVKLGTSGSR
jgi:site-specific recombinase XerC